jgi:protein phosphatase
VDASDNVTALAIMWQGSSVADQRGKVAATMISTEALPKACTAGP